MSSDRETRLEQEVAALVAELLTDDPDEDDVDEAYEAALDRARVLRPLLVEAHRVIIDRDGGGGYGDDELGACLLWADAGTLSLLDGRPLAEQLAVLDDASVRVGRLLGRLLDFRARLACWEGS